MAKYIFKRILTAIPLIIVITILCFSLIHLAPYDAIDAMTTPKMSPEMVQMIREKYGYDQPVYVQYIRWLEGILNGNFGYSIVTKTNIFDELATRIPNTIKLVLPSYLTAYVIAIVLGLVAGSHKNKWLDKLIDGICSLWIAMPTFWVAMLFIYLFGYKLRILPILGMHTVGVNTLSDFLLHFITPYVVLTLAFIPDNVRYVRSSTITQYSEDYVMVQKAFGASKAEIMFKHVCKNVLLPVITKLGMALPTLVTGAVITETVFSWPGIGPYFIQAVRGVSLHVDEGDILAIVGESGSGKSVTMKSVMGLLGENADVQADHLELLQKDLLSMSEKEKRKMRGKDMAMIFQDPMTALNPLKKIGYHMVEVLRRHQNLSKAEARKVAIDMLGKVGIPSAESRMDQYPHEFSGGMRQRVMIAMALCCQPRLLIADEPTTALDVTIQAQILQLLKQLNENEQMNIILITHDLGVVASLAKRIEVMYGGLIMEEGTTEEIFDHPTHPYTRALLHAIPKCESGCRERLEPIPGMAPSLANPPAGCPFVTRCRFACEECKKGIPSMRAYSDTQSSRCIFTKEELDEKEKKEEEK